jgi:hypothetical protein
MILSAPWLRAECLRVLHKYCAGVPTLTHAEARAIAIQAWHRRDQRFMQFVEPEDLNLINSCLMVEHAIRQDEFAALERLLTYCQFEDGDIDDRILALPPRAFARVVLDLYELGWIDHEVGM